jgi:hypothetical protein
MEDEIPSRRPTRRPSPGETVRPPFDPEVFARESESRLRVAHVATHVPVASPMDDADAPPTSQSATRLTAAGATADLPADEAVPFVAVSPEELEWFELDADAKAVLGIVNGERSIGHIADALGIGPTVASAVLVRLSHENIVGFR